MIINFFNKTKMSFKKYNPKIWFLNIYKCPSK
jgi:hypothetical protein